ncbi:MAG TPA: MFS transporter [Bryobacteraceae bacterium]|jgi:predicted MFS family arabinose efflux permease
MPASAHAISSKHRTAAVILAGFGAFLQIWATQPLLPLLQRLFHTSEITAGLTVTVPSLGVAVAAPFAGFLADRFGRRRVIVWSAFLLALSAFATSTATTLAQLLFWRFWQGVFTPGVFAITVAYINDEWREAGAGRMVAAYVSGTVSGGFSCRAISGLVAAHAPWQTVFLVLGALNFLVALAVWIWLPADSHTHAHTLERGWMAALTAHLQNRRLFAAFLVGFCVLFSLVGVFTYVTFYLAAPPFELQPAALGSIFFVYLAGIVVTPMAGRAIDKHGHRAALASAIVLSTIGIVITLSAHFWVVVFGLALCCTGVFVAQATASAYVGTATDKNRALAIGLYSTFYYLGGSAGASLPGIFYSRGGWAACAVFLALVQAVTVMVALSFWERPAMAASSGDVKSISA